RVFSLPPEPELPDAVFVEDTAVVVDEVAVITPMGIRSRRQELASVATVLGELRPLKFLSHSARLEGGDVMRVGRSLYVGVSSRTDCAGIEQLDQALSPHGYQLKVVKVKGCLHLKTGCTYLGRKTLLGNRAWVDMENIEG